MNIAIITEEDLFYVREFFKTFFKKSKTTFNYEITGITILPPFNKKSTLALAKQMYGFYGPINFIRVGTDYVIRKCIGKTIRSLAVREGIPVVDIKNVNSPEYLAWLKKKKIDVIVSIAAPVVFKKELLNSVKYCINSHSALLPENRGMMPVFWGLYKGSKEIGVTVHTMEEELDRGDIILQKRVHVGDESLDEMILKTKRISADLIHEALLQIAAGTEQLTPMEEGGSYQTFPTPAEVAEFRRRGKRMF